MSKREIAKHFGLSESLVYRLPDSKIIKYRMMMAEGVDQKCFEYVEEAMSLLSLINMNTAYKYRLDISSGSVVIKNEGGFSMSYSMTPEMMERMLERVAGIAEVYYEKR